MSEKLKIILTIDTEHNRSPVPNFIECDFGEKGNCGVNYIMEQFEKRNMRGVFFTNIYEHNNYNDEWENYIEKLIKRISDRNHEIGLHTHSSKNIPIYKKSLKDCTYDEQKEIIGYGTNFIKKVTGKSPIAHRGGNYACNDFTFKVLSDLGYKVDSSCWYFSSDKNGNDFKYYNSLNQVCMINNLIEFPVISVFNRAGNKTKFDINALNERDLISVVEQMKNREDFEMAQLMFHSFSFIDQKGYDGLEPYFEYGSHRCYGVSEILTKRFENFLDYLYSDPCIEVVTFEELLKGEFSVPSFWGDVIFHIDTEKSENALKEFKAKRFNERSIVNNLFNDFKDVISTSGGGDFDRCLDIDFNYLNSISNISDMAEKILNGYIIVYSDIEPMKYDISNFDWNISFSNMPDIFQLYLQGLNFIKILTIAFEKTKNTNYLKHSLKLLYSWCDYKSNDFNTKNNKFIWDSYSAALRTENLLYFVKICSSSGFWNDEMFIKISNMLLECGDWLNDDENYIKNHNYGIMMDVNLIYLGYVFDNKSWLENAKNRLLEQRNFVFNEKMAYTENNTLYGFSVREIFCNIEKFLKKINYDFS